MAARTKRTEMASAAATATVATRPPSNQSRCPRRTVNFYEIYETLNAEELATVKRVRAFMEAKVDLNLNLADGTYFLRARLNVSLPGVDREMAQAIVNEAHQICPYSQATRGNIDVAINLI